MTLQLNGVDIEIIGDDLKVDISRDGRKVTVSGPEPKVVERIRVVEVKGPEVIVERIRFIANPSPYVPYLPLPRPATPWVQPWNPWHPHTGPNWITGTTVVPTGTATGGILS